MICVCVCVQLFGVISLLIIPSHAHKVLTLLSMLIPVSYRTSHFAQDILLAVCHQGN